MAQCCGGRAPALDQAAHAMNLMMGIFEEEMAPAPQADAPVRLEFIGEQWGEQVWFSQDRQRQYKAGRDPNFRYIDVDPRDWQWLESFGTFARVALPVSVPDDDDDMAEVAVEPRVNARRGRKQ